MRPLSFVSSAEVRAAMADDADEQQMRDEGQRLQTERTEADALLDAAPMTDAEIDALLDAQLGAP